MCVCCDISQARTHAQAHTIFFRQYVRACVLSRYEHTAVIYLFLFHTLTIFFFFTHARTIFFFFTLFSLHTHALTHAHASACTHSHILSLPLFTPEGPSVGVFVRSESVTLESVFLHADFLPLSVAFFHNRVHWTSGQVADM
jgi:hypothetical protein